MLLIASCKHPADTQYVRFLRPPELQAPDGEKKILLWYFK